MVTICFLFFVGDRFMVTISNIMPDEATVSWTLIPGKYYRIGS